MKTPYSIFKSALDSQNNKDFIKSERLYKKLLKMEPDFESKKVILYNLGLLMMSMGRYKESITFFNKVNGLEKSDENQWNKCLCYLNLKEWDKAMDLFHHRYGKTRQKGTEVKFPNLPIKQIDDVNLSKDKNLLVLNEQGLGDQLLFSTQLSKLDKIVKYALVQVSDETYDLFNKIYKFENIELSKFKSISIEEVEKFDYYSGLGSVFSSLYEIGDSVIDIKDINYISPNNNKVGVCWTTNRLSPNTNQRSINPSLFKKIKYNLVNLQYGEGYGKELGLYDYLPKNCLETWDLLDNLDVVVTVDTMVAHLAGLKGIPTLLVINEYLDWRWKYRDKEDDRYSMFYPFIEIVNVNDNINDILYDILNNN